MSWQHFHVGPKLPGFDRKCVATLSTPINPITQENDNCIYGPFEVTSTYYKYKMTNAPQMHLVFCSGHGPKLPLRAKVTRNYGIVRWRSHMHHVVYVSPLVVAHMGCCRCLLAADQLTPPGRSALGRQPAL